MDPGQSVGEASVYDGRPNMLRIEPGTHEVDVKDPAGRIVFHQRVFIESETKTIEVH